LIKDLNKNLGISIIFVTHDLEQAKRMGDRAVLIVEGKKIEEGSIPEMFENPRSSELKKFLKGELK
jgi:ABC-type glutathione transport system ATPase component